MTQTTDAALVTPILLALAYTAMDQGEWWVAVGVALAGMVACMMDASHGR